MALSKEQAQDAFCVWDGSDMVKAKSLFDRHSIATLLLIEWGEVTSGELDGYEIRYDMSTISEDHMLTEDALERARGEMVELPFTPDTHESHEGLGYIRGRLFADERDKAMDMIEILCDLLYTEENHTLSQDTLE